MAKSHGFSAKIVLVHETMENLVESFLLSGDKMLSPCQVCNLESSCTVSPWKIQEKGRSA